MIKGGCLCGKVRYEFDGQIEEIAMCHCSLCRKAQGGAFATNSPVDSRKLKITGQEFITEYLEVEKNKFRAFCKYCGSPLYSRQKELPNIKRLRLGTIDTEFTCDNKYHIFSSSKASWHSISDDHPQYEKAKIKSSKK